MISFLKGKILHKDTTYLVLETGGVGYKVFITGTAMESLKGVETELWIHTAIRENSHDLYGFPSREELVFFELLITISGIGPKSALGILNVASLETLRKAVIQGNTGHLTKVSGIGKKNAEKIVLELQGKLGEVTPEEGYALRDEEDAMEALGSLGYSQKESRDALKEVGKDIASTSERVKLALKILSNKR